MMGPAPLRDILVVAGFELREMLRTRRVLILVTLFLLVGLAMSIGFVDVLERVEATAAEALGTTAGGRPGALTQQMMKEESYRKMLRQFFGDPEIAEFVLGLPPITAFYAWSSFAFVPFLIMINVADTVVQERVSRGVRFIAFRTGRLEFVLGKALGQTLLIALVTLLTAGMYLLVAWSELQGFELLPALHGVALLWPRVLAYGISFVGLAIFWSMVAGSTNTARAASLFSLLAFWLLSGAAERYRDGDFGLVWSVIGSLLPYTHQGELWRPGLIDVLLTCTVLVVLGVMYMAAGLAIFRRRDL